jgi:hypothetical protein
LGYCTNGLLLQRTIIQGLLTKDLTFRLGAMRGGAQDIKEHPYFKVGSAWL